ncbi:MAG TPA: hypothetical protein VFL27_10490 [Candidatus Dormibacteraeota bacterium]|nr:hypothetical protein [Candidatus Dormibacteraeota bacterium]
MATVEAVREDDRTRRPDPVAGWTRWWRAGTSLDWGFAILSVALVGAGYYQALVTRQTFPNVPGWASVPTQVAWLAITVYLGLAGFVAWRREGRLRALVPAGYEPSAVGIVVFMVGIVISGWWLDAFGSDFGVPAIFRLPNLLQITGGVLIVVGPLRASAGRGELTAGPTAVLSATMLLAAVTFFTQFDHPYVDEYATRLVPLPPPTSLLDQFNYKEEILGALGLMMQTVVVVGVVFWTLRQNRLPAGSLTFMLTVTAFLAATQQSRYATVVVSAVVGIVADIGLVLTRPRADRVLNLHAFAVALGLLLSGVYMVAISLEPGIWWPADMTFGVVLACGLLGGLVSYALFPGGDAVRAASVLWPAMTHESSAGAPDVTVERVEHALKVLHNTRDLADNPLVGMRCLGAHTPAELRKTIQEAIEHLRASAFQQDQQAAQILDLYYLRRIGGHYAVTMRVGLSRAAYFNRRSYGVRRLVDRLRELEESSAEPA